MTRSHNDTPIHSRSVDSIFRAGTMDGEYLGADTVRLTLNVSPPLVLYGRLSTDRNWERLAGTWACDSTFNRQPDSLQISLDPFWTDPLPGDWTYSPSLGIE